MAKTKHGRSWIARHLSDPYVKQANELGYRSRASFKLLELHQKKRLFHRGMRVVDLGAAPGGWSQVVMSLVGATGQVIALDRLEMSPIPGVIFIQGDFSELRILQSLETCLAGHALDWVLSDMAPNVSGMVAVDQPRMMTLAELAWDFARATLRPGGGLLVKVFQGEGFESFYRALKVNFRQVSVCKPNASRSSSREVYVLAEGYYNYSIPQEA